MDRTLSPHGAEIGPEEIPGKMPITCVDSPAFQLSIYFIGFMLHVTPNIKSDHYDKKSQIEGSF